MDSELKKENEIIDLNFINKLKEYNNKYLFVRDTYNEVVSELNQLNERFQILSDKMKDYNYLDDFKHGIKDKFISLKYEIKSYKEKILQNEEIIRSLKIDEESLEN